MRYFIDTEFDGYRGPLISMALVREDGRSLYFFLPAAAEAAKEPWVIENVIPVLKDCPESPMRLRDEEMGAEAIWDFLQGDVAPHVVADWPADLAYFARIIEHKPGMMIGLPSLTMEVKRFESYPSLLPGAVQHNAWWDAVSFQARVVADEEAAVIDEAEGFARP